MAQEDELGDATNNYCVNVRKGYPRVMDETDKYICNAFKAGAQWQKEQIIENACKWLATEFEEITRLHLDDKLIDMFRKAMEK